MQTFTAIEYLMIDVASSFGMDKSSWDDRIAWFTENEEELMDLLEEQDSSVLNKKLRIVEEPALFYAGLKAYQKAKRGEAISYPVSLDATASGAQLLALLVGCRKSASLCNVVDTGRREDLYTNVYEAMCERMGTNAKISRSPVKKAIMTSLYGSQAEPKRVFGEGPLLDTFFETMEEEATGIWQLNQLLASFWQSDALAHGWELPDGFNVEVKVMDNIVHNTHFMERPVSYTTRVNQPMEEGRSISANVIHSIDGMVVREVLRRCKYDPEQVAEAKRLLKQHAKAPYEPVADVKSKNVKMVQKLVALSQETGFISARIIDHIDADSVAFIPADLNVLGMIEELPKKSLPVLTVHDCFRVHPNYGNDLRKQYNLILSHISESTLIDKILSELAGEPVHLERMDNITADIANANYALS